MGKSCKGENLQCAGDSRYFDVIETHFSHTHRREDALVWVISGDGT